jgi:periplasmic protein TonB
MSAPALRWLNDEEPRDLVRWSAAGGIVVCVHAALIAGYLLWPRPQLEIGDDTPVISIDLAAAEIDQVEQVKIEQPIPPKETSEQADIPEQKPPEKVVPPSPAPRTTVQAPASAPRIDPSWQSLLLKRLQQFKSYPRQARQRNEQGVALLGFSVDRDGRVLASRIVQSSGHAELDDEVMTMIERAQPLPAFPASMTQEKVELTVPIRFSLH